ncbi:MAG: hypothetical protein IJR49_06635, partial [Treponema sp.]|nr:hypothetical protein [Treponema sp.]
AWLWGEKIQISTSFLLSYSDEVPIEDITVDLSYLHFYLKNIMPRFSIDSGAYIPNFSFVSFLKHSSCGFFESRKIFNDGKNWIEKNRMRYQTDVQHLIEQWVIEK